MNNNSEKNIHWFPGHMKKASDQIKDKLKLVDFVICLLDARSPYSTFNKYLLKIVENKYLISSSSPKENISSTLVLIESYNSLLGGLIPIK